MDWMDWGDEFPMPESASCFVQRLESKLGPFSFEGEEGLVEIQKPGCLGNFSVDTMENSEDKFRPCRLSC